MPRDVAAANHKADVRVNALAVEFGAVLSIVSSDKVKTPFSLRVVIRYWYNRDLSFYRITNNFYLAVTRQPAINVGIFLLMTFHTHSHPPVLGRQPLKVLYQSVAFPAGDFFVDMTLVVEQDMFRYVVYLHPGGGGLGVEVFVLLLDLRVFFDNIIMAMQTLFHRRYTRKI